MTADNSILGDLTFDDSRGALLYQGVRYLLIRPETLIAFQRAAEDKLGPGAGDLLFTGGFTGGSLSAAKYRAVFGLSDEQSVRFMARMGTEIGWGRIEIMRFCPDERQLVLSVESSPFAAAYGNATVGVCHLIRGVFAGLASGIFGCAVLAREEECAAMGHGRCIISVRAA